jgi:microcystin-dependent protein
MPYIVNFTDRENKTPITVFDNTSSQDTSLTFPGRNVTGYGQIIAENFLAILENFASASEPVNPVEGQLWYDTENNVLQLWDNTNWKAASNIQKSPVEPSVDNSKVGELWVDTTNQQLRIYTGTRWLLVGPSESSIDGLRYGPAVERITDSDNNTRNILILYIADQPVAIVSKDSFTPKIDIIGFDTIKSGINIAIPANDTEIAAFASIFEGGNLPKIIGTASDADALNVGGTTVAAGKFLRSDQINTTEFGFNVRNNSGLTVGADGNFNLSTSTTSAKIYNSTSGSSIDLQTNRNGIPSTILRVVDNKIGINVADPDTALEVDGDISLSGQIIINNTNESINLQTGSFITTGGAAITKNLKVGTTLDVAGATQLRDTYPAVSDVSDLGSTSNRWKNVYAAKIIADEIEGTINGNITGNANTATNLKNVTSFSLAGDVISPAVRFDGQVDGLSKVFNTELTANIIKNKDEPTPNESESNDFVLVYRASAETGGSSGLLKQTRNTFIADLGVPIGAIMPYAGSNLPEGYLLCDGGEVERAKFPQLYDVIGTTYNGLAALNGFGTFRLPDLRGRFALGRHNMDNNISVPTAAGGFIDNGGGTPVPARVEGTEAETLAATSGSSSVSLTLGNIPEHTHDMTANGIQYSAVRIDTAISPPGVTGSGPTAPGQAQYLQDSGGVKKPSADFTLGSPVGIMNPYQTLNYIIRSGPPAFETIGL